jgi:hypothetical protein
MMTELWIGFKEEKSIWSAQKGLKLSAAKKNAGSRRKEGSGLKSTGWVEDIPFDGRQLPLLTRLTGTEHSQEVPVTICQYGL